MLAFLWSYTISAGYFLRVSPLLFMYYNAFSDLGFQELYKMFTIHSFKPARFPVFDPQVAVGRTWASVRAMIQPTIPASPSGIDNQRTIQGSLDALQRIENGVHITKSDLTSNIVYCGPGFAFLMHAHSRVASRLNEISCHNLKSQLYNG